MKFRSKIYLFASGILFVILLIVNVAIYFSYSQFQMDKQEDALSNHAELILDNVSVQELRQEGGEILEPYRIDDGLVRFVDRNNEVIHKVIDEGDLKDIEPQMVHDEKKKQVTADDQPTLVYRYPVTLHEEDDDDEAIGTLELAASLKPIKENVSSLLSIMIFASLAALILSVLGGKLLSNLLLRPVADLNKTMKDVEESGEFQKIELGHRPKDELYALSETFDHMIDRLEASFEKQKQFVSDASHELKTPLTAIESYADLLRRWGSEDPEVREEALGTIRSEGHRMRMLIEQLLALAAGEGEEEGHHAEEIELVSFCEEVAHEFGEMYEREIAVRVMRPDRIELTWDRRRLRQILSILLDNALKYSEKPVEVFVDQQEETTKLIVRDEGIGIPAEDREQVFERFYRADPSRQRSTGGTGLGLPIAKALVEQRGGTIRVDSVEGKGTSVTVTFKQG